MIRIRSLSTHIAAFCLLACLATGILLAPAVALSAAALSAGHTLQSIPNVQLQDKNQFVSDPDRVLNAEDIRAINGIAMQLRRTYGIELAVVAVKSIGDNDARMFATDLFQLWGLGKKGEDNGLLVQLVTEPPQRSVVFEVGYGLEAYLPDVVCFRLQQRYMIPDLKENRYGLAMIKGIQGIQHYFDSGEYRRLPQQAADSSSFLGDEDYANGVAVLFFVVVFLFLLKFHPGLLKAILQAIFMGGGRGGRGGGGFGGGGFGGGGGGGSWGGGRSGGGGSISRF